VGGSQGYRSACSIPPSLCCVAALVAGDVLLDATVLSVTLMELAVLFLVVGYSAMPPVHHSTEPSGHVGSLLTVLAALTPQAHLAVLLTPVFVVLTPVVTAARLVVNDAILQVQPRGYRTWARSTSHRMLQCDAWSPFWLFDTATVCMRT
jgi:hypothetical protein